MHAIRSLAGQNRQPKMEFLFPLSLAWNGPYTRRRAARYNHKNNKLINIFNLKYNIKVKKKQQTILDNDILKDEIWKPVNIENFNHYHISNKGRVKSNIRKGGGGFLKHSLTKNGYYSVRLRNKEIDNKPHGFLVHRLIALSFIDNPNNYPIIDHINRIRTDNRIENLRWCDYSLNAQNRNIKGCIYKANDKRKLKDGTIKIYYYYRVSIGNKTKRFKTEEEAKNYLSKEISILNRTTK